MLATLFVTSAYADWGVDNIMVVEAVMIVDVMDAMTRRRDDDDEFWSIICDSVADSSKGCSPLPIVSSSTSLGGVTKRTRSDG